MDELGSLVCSETLVLVVSSLLEGSSVWEKLSFVVVSLKIELVKTELLDISSILDVASMELDNDSVVNSSAKLDESSAIELVVDWVKLADNSSDDETLMKLDSNSAVLDNSSVEIGLLAHEPMELDEEVPILDDS